MAIVSDTNTEATNGQHSFNKRYPLPRGLVAREDYILAQCVGKRVLHVGCGDYSSFGDWEAAVKSPRWLHGRIMQVAKEVVGIEYVSAAVDTLRNKYGHTNIFEGDAQNLDHSNLGTFDVIVAGEVLEHLPCPGDLWRSALPLLNPDGSLIITTINAYCARRFLRVLFGSESVHVDHVAYFSHRTLQRFAEMYGYRMVEQLNYRIPNKRPLLPYLVERFCCLFAPNTGEGIICRAQRA
jgi:2-polyprenyl-3-methyl-5-hydroxy-6-metoxy-1,4-benzoquinol methylase